MSRNERRLVAKFNKRFERFFKSFQICKSEIMKYHKDDRKVMIKALENTTL